MIEEEEVVEEEGKVKASAKGMQNQLTLSLLLKKRQLD